MTPEETDLEGLIERSRDGDEQAFQKLYDVLVDRIFSYTRSRVASREDALDCTQHIFIELWKSLNRFKYHSDPQLYGFIFTIAKRQIIRTQLEQRRLPENLLSEEKVADSPHDTETADFIDRALSTLKALDREIIILHHWSRYTFSEIAVMLSLKETAVRVRHHRALHSLKAHLTHHETRN